MTEKADLPSDTVSLPPTYAPSEAYTESPPPAYRKNGMAAVRVAKIVCFTLLAMTFIIGFFIVTHRLVQNKECNCSEIQSGSNLIQHAALLSQVPNLPNSDLNNNKIEEDIEKKETNLFGAEENKTEDLEVTPEEQIIRKDELKPDKTEEEESKNVNLPKDLLLGNPKMAGKNVHCKVQKRQRKIAEGIMTQAIIVTCDDEGDENEEDEEEFLDNKLPMPIVPLRPPMSLLSTIMKVLSSRPRSTDNKEEMQQQPMQPRFIPFQARPINGPFPMINPVKSPFPLPLSGPLSPILNFVPLRKIEMRRPFPLNEDNEPSPPVIIRQGPPPPPMMFHEARMPHGNVIFPPRRIMQQQEENNEHIQRIPFPFSGEPVPIRMIRLPSRDNIDEDETHPMHINEEENESPLPFPLHPLIKLLPARRRVIQFRPKESLDNMQGEPIPFPLPRGALPPRQPSDEQMPHPMPEASGRALPSPVALPGVRVVRLPFRPQPQPFPEAKVITHMEVREPKEDENQSQNIPENQNFRLGGNREFGPPKIHSLIENSPRPIFDDGETTRESSPSEPFHQEPITQTQSQPRFLAPPPPRFAREGRTSLLAQINPDAEVIPTNQNDRQDSSGSTMHRVVLN